MYASSFPNLELTIEQQFRLRTFEQEVKKLSPEDAQDLLINLIQQMMIKDNVIRHLLKQSP